MGKRRSLLDEYQFPGFRPKAGIQGIFGDPKARVILLERRQKKLFVDVAARSIGAITTRRCGRYGTYPVEMLGFIWRWRCGGSSAGSAGR